MAEISIKPTKQERRAARIVWDGDLELKQKINKRQKLQKKITILNCEIMHRMAPLICEWTHMIEEHSGNRNSNAFFKNNRTGCSFHYGMATDCGIYWRKFAATIFCKCKSCVADEKSEVTCMCEPCKAIRELNDQVREEVEMTVPHSDLQVFAIHGFSCTSNACDCDTTDEEAGENTEQTHNTSESDDSEA